MKGRIVSIDAWREPEGGWSWNQSYTLRDNVEFNNAITARQFFKWMREEGFLSDWSKGRVRLQDDWPILEIQDKNNGRPLFAFEADEYN